MTVQQFRKRPVAVQAIQWTGDNEREIREFAGGNFGAVDPEDRANSDDPENTGAVLDSLHSSWIGLRTGDWVVRGPRGEFYAIKDDVLRETYEPVTAADPAEDDAPTCRDCGTWPCARHATAEDKAEYAQATSSESSATEAESGSAR